ncbi:MAG: plastocyanin/azurin family copper-binding protein [Actinomycetota bacterium]
MKIERWVVLISASVLLLATACSTSTSESSATPEAASGSGATSGEAVAVSLKQWSITPTATTLPSGSITFDVSNEGTIPHEFVVMSTDTLAADFPISSFEGEADRFDEDTAGTNAGETGDMEAGATQALMLDLAPGHYAFVCNLPEHYGQGMHVDFTVT